VIKVGIYGAPHIPAKLQPRTSMVTTDRAECLH